MISKEQRSAGALIFGVDPEREASLSTLSHVISHGAYLKADDKRGVLLGEKLADSLVATIGDEIVFLGQGADGSIAAGKLIVRGLFSLGINEMDRTTVVAPISTIQEAFSMQGAVSEIALLLDHDKHRPQVIEEIKVQLEDANMEQAVVLGWPELLPGVEQSIRLDWIGGVILYLVLALVVGFGIANTFLMAFLERVHEFGVLLSLGMRPVQLFLLVYIESVLTIGGIFLGLLLGVLITFYYQREGINFGGSEELFSQYGLNPLIHPQISIYVMTWAISIVSVIALLAAFYPAVKAGHLKPVEALRRT